MTPSEALARIREIVDACGSPGCVACPRAIRETVGEVDEQGSERMELLAAEVHRLRQEVARLKMEVPK